MAGVIELVNHDLRWMGLLHDDDEIASPVVLPPLRDARGVVLTEDQHTMIVGAGLAMVHLGLPPADAFISPLTQDLARQVALRFFMHEGLTGVRTMSLDAFTRWCEAAPPVTRVTCPACNGTLFDPSGEVHVDDTSMKLACQRCQGIGFLVGNFDEGLDKIGPVTFDRRSLRRILPHLRGAEVGLAFSPSISEPGAMEAHVRQLRTVGSMGQWGDWRIALADLGA